MPTERLYAKRWRQQLIQDWLDKLEADGERIAKQMERIAKNILKATLRFSSQFGTSGKSSQYLKGVSVPKLTYGVSDAEIEVESEVRVDRRGLKITLKITVVDPSGQPHFVWHLLSEGRPSFKQRKTSPPIRERSGLRTTPGTLEVSGFPGFTGEVFVIPAGTVVGSIPPRKWYEQAEKEFRTEFGQIVGAQLLDLEITKSKINKLRRSSP